jgi:phosphatidylglycerophosphatase A
VTPARLIASGFGSGFAPAAPGTAGSLVGLAVGIVCLAMSPRALLAMCLITGGGGLLATSAATGLPLRARGTLDHADPGWVVIDEICGQCCALLLLPHPSWSGAVLAFALFRLLDITKPGPIGWLDRQGGAAGIMADDVLAGLIAAVGTKGLLILYAHLSA